jgi:hypothetical protein
MYLRQEGFIRNARIAACDELRPPPTARRRKADTSAHIEAGVRRAIERRLAAIAS